MGIQEVQEKFEDLLLANPDFDESLLGKDEEGCYSDCDIQYMYSMFEAGTEVGEQWQAAKAQAVPETKKFNLDEFLAMEKKLKHKGGVITADLDRFIAYAESVLIQAKALKESK